MTASRMGAAFLFIAMLTAAPASGEAILFSSLGPDDSFDQDVALVFGFTDDPDRRFARAMPFRPGSTATLRTLDLALQFPFAFSAGTLVVNLFNDDGGLRTAAGDVHANRTPGARRALAQLCSATGAPVNFTTPG